MHVMKRSIERGVGDGTVTEAIVAAVAEAKGIDRMELTSPLYEVIDTDALERLFEPTFRGGDRTGGRVTFDIAGHEVVVHGRDRVVVTSSVERDSRVRVSGTVD